MLGYESGNITTSSGITKDASLGNLNREDTSSIVLATTTITSGIAINATRSKNRTPGKAWRSQTAGITSVFVNGTEIFEATAIKASATIVKTARFRCLIQGRGTKASAKRARTSQPTPVYALWVQLVQFRTELPTSSRLATTTLRPIEP